MTKEQLLAEKKLVHNLRYSAGSNATTYYKPRMDYINLLLKCL